MSMIDEFKNDFILKVRQLSQDEGLRDHEIAEMTGYSRATVNRARRAYDIPTANLRNRLDKECVCAYCGKTTVVRRKERRKKRCSDCTVT